MPILTNTLIEASWKTPKLTDGHCKGLFAIKTRDGVTFHLKFTDAAGNRRSHKIGAYHRNTFGIVEARAAAYALKSRIDGGENVIQTARLEQARDVAQGRTVDQVIAERIEWMKTPERKRDGVMRPRIETWANTASHLRRFLGKPLGRRIISEVTRRDIAEASDALAVESVSKARHFRRAASGLFNWAMEPPREYVTTSPCDHLPKLAKEHSRERFLSPAEIATLWNGLDDGKVSLAIKFGLATMLRSAEFMNLKRSEVKNLDGKFPYVEIPMHRVKKRRVIHQPLSPLAVEIIKQAMQDDEYVFQSPIAVEPIHRHALATALRGRKDKGTIGLCEKLGLAEFTPHDLRRTAATLAGELGYRDTLIAKCLDHQAKGADAAPAVTGIYNRAVAKTMHEKLSVLNGVADALIKIVNGEWQEPEYDFALAA
jgi:integrase